MIQPQDKTSVAVQEPLRRSRWRRFSPSMGWRAFWSEIVIVVLGVAIALAANEAVNAWNWRNKVKDAEARLQVDITWVFLWSAEKTVTQPCVDAQLAAMSRRVLESGEMLSPMPVFTTLGREQVVRMPTRPWRFPVWEALLADGTASHFPAQLQAVLGGISHDMTRARAYEAETRSLGGSLLLMRDPIALDPMVRAELLTRINTLRSLWQHERLYARQLLRLIADAGNAPPEAVVERFLNADGKHSAGNDHSGMPHFCTTNGLPLADWRDYRELSANVGAPVEGNAK
jgi:hypothetical protein